MMYQTIKNFAQQFKYEPKIANGKYLKTFNRFIVLGMGGSHLAADILKTWQPAWDIIAHHNYGLPSLPEKDLKENLIIVSSYSGDTEEVIDGLLQALQKNLSVAVIAKGGKLIKLAKTHSMPYIQLPEVKIQTRLALGFNFRALLKITSKEKELKETNILANLLNSNKQEKQGEELAKKLKNFIPLIYSSSQNYSLAYNWKIKFNETAKIPAFCNELPELNHNEMAGFSYKNPAFAHFYFIFLKDKNDHPKILRRMLVLEKILRDKKWPVEIIELNNKIPPAKISLTASQRELYRIFSCLILADWTTYYLDKEYGYEPDKTPLIEEFKKLIIR